jgi:hypothetical protein
MEDQLINSVAAVLKDDGSIAGTAFLFRRGEAFCFWLTCHHVVADLSCLRLAFGHGDPENPLVKEAVYLKEYSRPDKDIAVLQTPTYPELQGFIPLPMGGAPLDTYQFEMEAIGIGFAPNNLKNYPEGQVYKAAMRRGQKGAFSFGLDPEIRARITALNNPWNVVAEVASIQVLNLNNADVPIEQGYSGGPICIDDGEGNLMAIGMVNLAARYPAYQMRETEIKVRSSGMAISFEEIYSVVGTLIPFHRYADCVIIVLAAKQDEMERYLKSVEKLWAPSVVHSSYDENDRDKWVSFDSELKETIELLLRESRPRYNWQLATVYLESAELEAYFKETDGAVLFIVDSCSVCIPELQRMIGEADTQVHRATYLFPMCELRFLGPMREELRKFKNDSLARVVRNANARNRSEECATKHDFKKRVEALIELAVKQSMQLTGQDRIDQRFSRADIGAAQGVNRQPTLNFRRNG